MPHTRSSALVVALLAAACRPTAAPEAPRDSSRRTAIVATPSLQMPPRPPTDAARLIVMGDSISAGAGASRPSDLAYGALLASNDDARWPDAVGFDLATRFGHPVPVINVAVPGATAGSMLTEQPARLRQRLPWPVRGHSIVVMTIGGNDLTDSIAAGDPAGAPLTQTLGALRATATILDDRANFPDGVSFYVATVFDPTDGEGFAAGCFYDLHLATFVTALDVWRARYVNLGRELGFGVVDALGRFHGHGRNHRHATNTYYDRDDPSGWFSDCVHPNDRGHHEMRRLFFEAITGSGRALHVGDGGA